jgi:hypothetical protein
MFWRDLDDFKSWQVTWEIPQIEESSMTPATIQQCLQL